MVISFFLALWAVIAGMINWTNRPITTTVTSVAIKDAPFPSVAICPSVQNVHNSWTVTSLVYNFLELMECEGACNTNAIQEFRQSFQEFLEKIVDRYMSSEDNPSAMIGLTFEDGTPRPGGFALPTGYKGLPMDYPFYLLYCELAKVLDQKQDSSLILKITNRLKEAVVQNTKYDLDVILMEEGVTLDVEGVSFFDFISKDCDCSDETMRVLARLYFFNSNVLFKNFGTSMELLMEYGDLQIQSWNSRLKTVTEFGFTHVSSEP